MLSGESYCRVWTSNTEAFVEHQLVAWSPHAPWNMNDSTRGPSCCFVISRELMIVTCWGSCIIDLIRQPIKKCINCTYYSKHTWQLVRTWRRNLRSKAILLISRRIRQSKTCNEDVLSFLQWIMRIFSNMNTSDITVLRLRCRLCYH